MTGRGRGEPKYLPQDNPQTFGRTPVLTLAGGSSSDSDSTSQERSSGDILVRGRGAYRQLNTIPVGIRETRTIQLPKGSKAMTVLTNYVKLTPMKSHNVYQYRIDFEPDIESTQLRRSVMMNTEIKQDLFRTHLTFDGMYDARSSVQLPQPETSLTLPVPLPDGASRQVKVTIKKVGKVEFGSGEMLRLYNMNMRDFLRTLGFFQLQRGVYVHPQINTPLPANNLKILRGFNTVANIHKNNDILMNFEPVHKIVQEKTVLAILEQVFARSRGNQREACNAFFTNKIVVTKYNLKCYRVESVDFSLNPRKTFDWKGKQVTYEQYFKTSYNISLTKLDQPLLRVKMNSRRREPEADERPIFIPPEVCTMAGLTEEQMNDGRLRMELVRASQLSPQTRVENLNILLQKLHSNTTVREILNKWGYDYERTATVTQAHKFFPEPIQWKSCTGQPDTWPKTEEATGSLDNHLNREQICTQPPIFKKMTILFPRNEEGAKNGVLQTLQQGFQKVGLRVAGVDTIMIPDERPSTYANHLRNLQTSGDGELTMVFLSRQNKERYDTIKRYMTCDRGLITQVVTLKLMTDGRKNKSAASKIAVQIAAKMGGEPWRVYVPLGDTMICGYDTYHDTTNRGRSFGAFVASSNKQFSKWFSRASSSEKLDELSTNLCAFFMASLKNYFEKNGNKYPAKVIIYRDGVGDGQLEHVFKVEVKQMKKVIKQVTGDRDNIKLTVIIVNKRIGARFFVERNFDGRVEYKNPMPGTCIDKTVTRQERYDFYLVSQSTGQGTVTPTYYNIIHDDSGLPLERLQLLTFKMTLNYYNWTGGVRVPAPCQYAHKLALQCGEHTHAEPSASLSNSLHFL